MAFSGPSNGASNARDMKNRNFRQYLALSGKQYKIRPYSYYGMRANRKTYPSFRMVTFSMTFSEHYRMQILRSRYYSTSNNASASR